MIPEDVPDSLKTERTSRASVARRSGSTAFSALVWPAATDQAARMASVPSTTSALSLGSALINARGPSTVASSSTTSGAGRARATFRN